MKLIGAKIIWTVHDLKNHENIQVRSEQIFNILFAKFVSAIITQCEVAQQKAIESFQWKNDVKLLLLFVGLIHSYKRVPEPIDAFKQLNAEGVYLAIAGKTSNVLAQQISQMTRGQDNIKFIPGFVPDNQVQVYMNACGAIVLPYRDILTSGSMILAMSFGPACIAPRKGCIKEILDDSGGILSEPDDENSLFKALELAVKKIRSVTYGRA